VAFWPRWAALPISKILADLIFQVIFNNDAMLAFDFPWQPGLARHCPALVGSR